MSDAQPCGTEVSREDKPRAWIAVLLLWIAFFLNYVDRQAAFAIFPALQQDLGFTAIQLGLVGTVFIWSYALMMPPAGKLADHFPYRKLVTASLVLWSLAMLGTALSPSINVFLAWRAAMGITEALYFPAAVALIVSLHGGATRSRALAFHQSAQLVGGAAGTSLGGWMADHTGWRAGFGWLALIGVAYAFLLHFFLRRMPHRAQPLARSASSVTLQIFRSIRMNLLLVSFFFFCALLWMIYAWLPSHVYQKFQLSMTESGVLTGLSLQGSSLVGVIAGGYLGDKFRRIVVACAGLILSPPLAYLVFASDNLAAALMATAAFGLVAGFFQANVFAGAYDLVLGSNFGFATGVLNGAGGIAGGLGILFTGIFRESIGLATVVGAAAVLTVASGVALLTAELTHRVPSPSEVRH